MCGNCCANSYLNDDLVDREVDHNVNNKSEISYICMQNRYKKYENLFSYKSK